MGGGSGGHITPIVAVIGELKKRAPTAELRVWTDKKFALQARQMLGGAARVDVIASGKLRRYANLKWWYKYFSWYHISKTHWPNFVDAFKIVGGFGQSFAKLLRWRPNVVFCKGGFVGLPVGLAAHLLKIPLVIHDSDTVPGLTNRVLARWACAIGTGAPIENYPNYDPKITRFIGIPVRPEFRKLSARQKAAAKKLFKLDADKPLVLAIGGGGGAREINETVLQIAPELVRGGAQIFIVAGKNGRDNLAAPIPAGVTVADFVSDDMARLLGAADVVVTRAGATFLAELAAVGAAAIIVPSPYLAGDHQTKNAAVYEKAGAAVVLNQKALAQNPEILAREIIKLLNDKNLREKLGKNLAKFAKPDALAAMADLILKAVQK